MPADAKIRRARKAHWCWTCSAYAIKAGDLYRSQTYFPGDDGFDYDRPERYEECAGCSARYSRPITAPAAR